MEPILNILAFLIAVFVLILIHESGHFLVARWCGVKVVRFSIGFGKALYKWKGKNGTEYVIALVPLGGYIKMLDRREMKVKPQEEHLAFDVKKVWQRMLIILAGPVTNIIFALLVFWFMLVIGIMQPKAIIGEVIPQSIANLAGLQAQDEIVTVANKETNNWQKTVLTLFSYVGDKIDLPITIKRINKNGVIEKKKYSLDLSKWKLDEWQPDPLRDLGVVPYQPLIPVIVGEVSFRSPAANAGLVSGDKIISIAGQHFSDWEKMIKFIQTKPNQQLLFVVNRDGKTIRQQVATSWKFGPRWRKIGYLGIKPVPVEWPPAMTYEEKHAPFGALIPALQQSYDFIAFNVIMLQKLFSGKLTLRVLGGPVAIFQSASLALQKGAIVYVGFLGLLSLMLAFVNLLPIPALDGGYIVFLLYEIIVRKPISLAVQELILRLGLIFLILLMFQGMFNDLKRLFG